MQFLVINPEQCFPQHNPIFSRFTAMPAKFIVETIAKVQKQLDMPPEDNTPLPYVVLYCSHLIHLLLALIQEIAACMMPSTPLRSLPHN